ncbi:MAG: hypothetical protein JWN54_821 [Mycobacterium sp.]|nr:hypothetical protein [Mycobacterium sp.]
MLTVGQATHAGLTRAAIDVRLRRGEWRHVLRGTYLIDADLLPEPPHRARARAATLAVPGGVLCGVSAAALLGLRGAERDRASVEITVPSGHRVRPQRGLALRQVTVPAARVVMVDGMRVTSPLWTVGDLLLRLGRMEAVGVLDAALHDGSVRRADLDELDLLIARRRGAVAARRRIEECDGRAESPLETRVRLICRDGGVPPDALQQQVLDRWGNVLGYGDLAWTYGRLIAETDGRAAHDSLPAAYRDRHRANDFRTTGWTIVRFTWADTAHPGYIVSVVRRALTAAA